VDRAMGASTQAEVDGGEAAMGMGQIFWRASDWRMCNNWVQMRGSRLLASTGRANVTWFGAGLQEPFKAKG